MRSQRCQLLRRAGRRLCRDEFVSSEVNAAPEANEGILHRLPLSGEAFGNGADLGLGRYYSLV